MHPENFIKEKEKELKKEMDEVFFGKTPRCTISDCPGSQFRASGLCQVHFQERLDARNKQMEDDSKKSPDPQSREVAMGQAREAYFAGNRKCESCGLGGLKYSQGKAVYRKGYPKKTGSVLQGLWTLCNDCLKSN